MLIYSYKITNAPHRKYKDMKKTEYKVITSYSQSCATTYKRVYVDCNGQRYIKVKDGYKCIEGTPCVTYMFKD